MMQSSRQHQGFTLLELMVVMVIVGILAVTALPALLRASGPSVYEERDQLLWLLNQVQQRSMQDTAQRTSLCPTLVLSSNQIGIATSNACAANASFAATPDDPRQLQLNSGHQLQGLALPTLLRFDSWGQPEGACAAGCTLTVSDGSASAQICVAATGLADAC